MVDRWKIFALVTLVAVLIWAYAEARSLRTEETPLTVRLVTPADSDLIVQPDERWASRATVTLSGPAAALDRFDRQLTATDRTVVLRPASGLPADPGNYTVDLKTALETIEPFKSLSVTITKVEPSTVSVIVDELINREARVRVPTQEMLLNGPPEPQPGIVNVRFPARVRDRLPQELEVTARISAQDLRTLPEGVRQQIPSVPLDPPESLAGVQHVRIDPPTVTVSLMLRSRSASIVLPSVPVHLQMAAIEQPNWDVIVDSDDLFLHDVEVTGPAELIEQIRQEAVRVFAIVRLTLDDLEAGVTEKEAVIELPSPMLNSEVGRRVVRLQIRRRAEPEGSAPEGPP